MGALLPTSVMHSFFKGCEKGIFELGSERVKCPGIEGIESVINSSEQLVIVS